MRSDSEFVRPFLSVESDFRISAARPTRNTDLVRSESLADSVAQEVIGPRQINGWDLQDVRGDGNCFYRAIADQINRVDPDLFQGLERGREHVTLRRIVSGNGDGIWAEDDDLDQFVRAFSGRYVLAIVDTRMPQCGYSYRYLNREGELITNNGSNLSLFDIPRNRSIIRIAATGNHFLSVISGPCGLDSESVSCDSDCDESDQETLEANTS